MWYNENKYTNCSNHTQGVIKINIFDELDFLSEEDINSLRNFFEESHKAFLEKLNMTEEDYNAFCEPYLKEASAFTDLIKAQKGNKQLLEKSLLEHAFREEKSRGGENIHRGFYCPSLIQDIVVGNCKRGSLCKSNNPKATYTHYFDSNNNHIATRRQEGKFIATEYILYDNNKSLGIMFDDMNQLETIAECEYDEDGRILKYVLALCDTKNDTVIEFYKEFYTYSKENIVVETSNLNCNISPVLLSLNKYSFRVESGLLKKYTVEVFDNEDISGQPLNTRCYNVKIKRKTLTKD